MYPVSVVEKPLSVRYFFLDQSDLQSCDGLCQQGDCHSAWATGIYPVLSVTCSNHPLQFPDVTGIGLLTASGIPCTVRHFILHA